MTLNVYIVDVDDNIPEFNAETFSGGIWEQAALGDFVTLASPGFISIEDKDRGVRNSPIVNAAFLEI